MLSLPGPSTEQKPNPASTASSLRRHTIVALALTALLLGAGGTWAFTTELSSAVVAEGMVIVDSNVKKIQHLTGGIVEKILVKEGQHVEAGDELITLDGTTARANLQIIESGLAQGYARRARLHAERLGAADFKVKDDLTEFTDAENAKRLEEEERKLFQSRKKTLSLMRDQLQSRKGQLIEEISGLDSKITSAKDAIASVMQEEKSVAKLIEKKLVSMQRVENLKRQRNELEGDLGGYIAARAQAEGKISETELQMLQVDEERQNEVGKDLTDTEARISELEQKRGAARTEMLRLSVIAPVSGKVLQLAVHTVHGVVNPSEPIMQIVPDEDELTVEARISIRDIDQVHPGQPVDLRFSAFDQRTTPVVEGTVVSVAGDVIRDQVSGSYYYPVRVRPLAESVEKLKGMTLYPGMPAEVFIKIADRTVISYLVKPLTDQIAHTWREE
jgi:membrane fusion protein